MRWREAELILEPLWRSLPDRYKYNHQLQRLDAQFVNWDCSVEGFEGIRCQDILPLLIRRFYFHTFLAYGNLTDVFVDRSDGHNFDPQNPADLAFIQHLARLNDVLIGHGVIKPTMLFASMSKSPSEMTCYRRWRPEFCLRDPAHEQLQLTSETAELMRRQVSAWAADFDSKTTDLREVILQIVNLENQLNFIQAEVVRNGAGHALD